MKHVIISSVLTIVLSGALNVSMASDPIVFPAKGQSNEQMEKDKYACYGWSKKETGFDPELGPDIRMGELKGGLEPSPLSKEQLFKISSTPKTSWKRFLYPQLLTTLVSTLDIPQHEIPIILVVHHMSYNSGLSSG